MSLQPNPRIETRLPTGVKDFLPLKAARLEFLHTQLRDVFRRWGFRPVSPAILEDLAVLERGLGADLREKTFRFDDRQTGRLVAFPPDITPQVARIAATRMHDMPLPFRLCYRGRVLRHAEQRLGKERQIHQAGVELIGLDSAEADAEMIAMAVECLRAVGADDFTIDIGQVDFLRAILADLPLDATQTAELLALIAAKDSFGLNRRLEALPLSSAQCEELSALPRLFGGEDVIERATRCVHNPTARQALENLQQVLEMLKVYRVEPYLTIDLGELRGFDYHTGVIFQGFLTGFGRAVCAGGRYDNLTGRYGFPAPATGFSFDLYRLLVALGADIATDRAAGIDILLFASGADKATAQRLAVTLRAQGYSVARDIIRRDRQASLDYARRMQFRHLLILDEQAPRPTLIRTADGEQTEVDLADIENGGLKL
ncbi:MAG: ATP phosphoribosyltransferase regulatory subunit [Desulfuromonadales bacterium]|nr:ATP phosphoribosyltransferase regulatory subunit [Desulfuromonadales bacterium]